MTNAHNKLHQTDIGKLFILSDVFNLHCYESKNNKAVNPHIGATRTSKCLVFFSGKKDHSIIRIVTD